MNPEPEIQDLRNAYTDAPELHRNLILGGVQLLFWLFFHPSAWRSYVARVDPDLRPDFCLAELSRAQWRILMVGYGVWPFLASLLVILALLALGESGPSIVSSIAFIIAVSTMFSVAVGVSHGLAAIAAAIMASIVAFVVASAMGVGLASVVLVVASGIVGGVALVVTIGMEGRVPGWRTSQSLTSLTRQMGGVIIGVLIGGPAVGAAYIMADDMVDILAGGKEHGLAAGLAVGIAVGLAVGWRTQRWRRGLTVGVSFGIFFGVASGVVGSMFSGVASSARFVAFFALPYLLAERSGGRWASAVAGALASGGMEIFLTPAEIPPLWSIVSLGLIIALGLTLAWWRPVALYPFQAAWNFLLYRADERRADDRPSLLRWHSAFWDEYQRWPQFGLDEHLLLVMERNPPEGQAAMAYLITSHQRWAAQAAQIELDARGLERCANVQAISNAYQGLAAGELTGPASALLRSFSRVSQDVDAALHQESVYNQRLALSAVEDRLDGLSRELTRSSERYAVRFHPIAERWRQIVADHARRLAEEAERRQEIDSPYIIGVPLTERQEIFVGRADVSARIEGLLLDRRRPPLLLYGQRRTGKTSLLNNLGRLLPSTIVPLFVDLQGPATQASDHAGFLYNIARGMVDSARRQRGLALPLLTREMLVADPFTRFDEWLDQVEAALGQGTALLALDEFETLDNAIARGRFDEEAALGTLRHLIQHRPRFKVLLAGSHTLDELGRWASYLINMQVAHIGYLKEGEARQLIERPVKDFPLRYEPDASQRVLDLTRGHPFLVQLLCAEIVALKNEQQPATRRLARLADVDAAVPEALSHGSFFFADIERNQVDAVGLSILRFLAAQREGAVVDREALTRLLPDPYELDRALALLTRRELIEPVNGGYRFQVELIRRWFASFK